MIVEESQLKGSRFYENLEPDVSPGYTGKLNSGKYVELSGTKKFSVPIQNKPAPAGGDLLTSMDVTSASPRFTYDSINQIMKLNGDSLNIDEIIITMNLASSFPADTLIRLTFNFDYSFVPSDPAYVSSAGIDYIDLGFGYVYAGRFVTGYSDSLFKIKAGTSSIKIKIESDAQLEAKILNTSIFAITYVPTYITFYDIDQRKHIQYQVPFSTSYEFKDIKVNNIMTTYSKMDIHDLAILDNEPEAILKQLYNGRSAGFDIDIGDITRYYPVMENGNSNKVHNILAKLLGPGFIFTSALSSTSMTIHPVVGEVPEVVVNSVASIVSNSTTIKSDNMLTGGLVVFTTKEPEKIKKIDITSDLHMTGSFPDFSDFVNLEELIIRFDAEGTSIDWSLFSGLTKLRELNTIYAKISGDVDTRDTNLEELQMWSCGLDGDLLGLSDSTIIVKFSGNNLKSMPVDIIANKPELVSFDIRTNHNLVADFPDVSTAPKLETLILGYTKIKGTLPTFDNNPELKLIDIGGTDVSGAIPAFIHNLKMEEIEMRSCSGLTGKIPDYDHLPVLSSFIISGNSFLTNTGTPFPKFPASIRHITINNLIKFTSIPSSPSWPNLENFDAGSTTGWGNADFSWLTSMTNMLNFNLLSIDATGVPMPDCSNFSATLPPGTRGIINLQKVAWGGIMTDVPGSCDSFYVGGKDPMTCTGTLPTLAACTKLSILTIKNAPLVTGSISDHSAARGPENFGFIYQVLPLVTGDIPRFTYIDLVSGHDTFTGTGPIKINVTGVTGYAGNGTVPAGNIKTGVRDYRGNALTQTAVDNILKEFSLQTDITPLTKLDLKLENYSVGDQIFLSRYVLAGEEGTNAVPSAAGIVAMNNLIAKGAKVTVAT